MREKKRHETVALTQELLGLSWGQQVESYYTGTLYLVYRIRTRASKPNKRVRGSAGMHIFCHSLIREQANRQYTQFRVMMADLYGG